MARYFVTTLRKIGLAATSAADGPRRRRERSSCVAPPVAHPAAFLADFRGRTGDVELDADIAAPHGRARSRRRTTGPSVDERLVDEALRRALGSQRLPTFLSERIDVQGCARFHPVFGADLASLCLQVGNRARGKNPQ